MGLAICSLVYLATQATPTERGDLTPWRFSPPLADSGGVCTGTIGNLPSFSVTPPFPGEHLVRVSVPFAPGALPDALQLEAVCRDKRVPAGFRVLTRHPGRPASVRRGIVTLPFRFESAEPHVFSLELANSAASPAAFQLESHENAHVFANNNFTLRLTPERVEWEGPGGEAWQARPVAPPCPGARSELDVIENGRYYLWARLRVSGPEWPRIIDVQADAFGTVAVRLELMRTGDAPPEDRPTAPDIGWRIEGGFPELAKHSFADGEPFPGLPEPAPLSVSLPDAHLLRRGYALAEPGQFTYLRCAAGEKVPHQAMAWRHAACVIGPKGTTPRNALLEPDLDIQVAPEHYNSIYESGCEADLALWPRVDDCRRYVRESMLAMQAVGDDYGNITSATHGNPHGAVVGMNRLNHAPAMLEEAYRSGGMALRDAAVLWCVNMHDLSLWWGSDSDFGGTRYNNARIDDPSYMWRRNGASNFCTKGFDTFFYAYEETGDPRMLTALRGQLAYAGEHVHADRGECRNIGAASDFLNLYRFTGMDVYRGEAMRLFHELRTKLSPGGLFSQGGQPIVDDPPFINDDKTGYKHPFAKPYIIGYGLLGLPKLLELEPGEPRLREVVRAVADFLAASQDPVGGWRYPHPRSTSIAFSHSVEVAAQMARAAHVLEKRGDPIGNLLDAIERALQAQVNSYLTHGTPLTSVGDWERAAGLLEDKTIYDLYEKPADRDASRDYAEGIISAGYMPPESLVYFTDALRFYLAHRPAERLLDANEPLSTVLSRLEDRRLQVSALEGEANVRVTAPGTGTQAAVSIRGVSLQGGGPFELDLANLPWQTDSGTGTLSFSARRDNGTFTASFEPRVDYAACTFTFWPAEEVHPEGTLQVDLALEAPLASGAGWAAALAAESQGTSKVTPNTGQVAASRPLRKDGPTVVRARVYLVPGKLGLPARIQKDTARWDSTVPAPSEAVLQTDTYGLRSMLPAFNDARVRRMAFPLSWQRAGLPFEDWKTKARRVYLETLSTPPPPAPFNPTVIAVEQRDGYEARKLALNINADCRIKAYLLVPEGLGPFPAVAGLHDHGAHFSIGKEKVVRPFDEPRDVLEDAREWVETCYGGRWFGDELAKRGYVVLAIDVLFWGDRGRFEGVKYEEQQALAANMFQLGYSWGGYNVWDDVRSVEFLRGLPEVDPDRIASAGLSMGSNRSWHLAAASEHVRAGIAICWMGDTPTLTAEGNNQTKGQSAFSMLHPGLRNHLDYAHAAAIACPKPMLFYNGTQDGLFPVEGVEAAYQDLHAVYASQNARDRLVTKLWPVPHEFNREMQDEAFDWLDRWMKE